MIERRVCARFVILRGPRERLGRRKSEESGKTYPGTILLGPWIIAVYSPADGAEPLSSNFAGIERSPRAPGCRTTARPRRRPIPDRRHVFLAVTKRPYRPVGRDRALQL